VILPEPDRQRLLGVIFPGDQLPPARVAPAGDLRAVGDQVVVHAAVAAQPAVEHPAANFAVRQVEHDDAVDVVALQDLGQGETIVFFEIDGYSPADLAAYAARFGLPPFAEPLPHIGPLNLEREPGSVRGHFLSHRRGRREQCRQARRAGRDVGLYQSRIAIQVNECR